MHVNGGGGHVNGDGHRNGGGHGNGGGHVNGGGHGNGGDGLESLTLTTYVPHMCPYFLIVPTILFLLQNLV